MRLSKYFKTEYLLILLLFLGFLVRLYRFDSPIADWHSWRQADTSAVSRNFVNSGFDFLHPKFDDLSNVPSGLDNPNGYRFVEFPLYNFFQAITFKTLGIFSLEEWGRLVTIFASLFSAVFIFLLVKKRFGYLTAAFSLGFFLFLPFNIYYSRTILPDPSMVMAILGGTYFFELWLKEKSQISNLKSQIFSIAIFYFAMALVLISVAFLLKPYALFFTLPIVFLAFEKFGLKIFKQWKLYIFTVISIIPLILWRNWIMQFPEGIPASNWLFNGNGIRFRPSFFYWIIYERLFKLILGYFGSIILIAAFFQKYSKQNLLFVLSFVLSSLIYICVMATGNVQHDYYQILIIPSISIVLGIGSVFVLNSLEKKQKYLGILTVSIILVLGFYFSWNQVKDYFNINNSAIVLAGKAVDRLTPKDAKVIANYNGDTSFLYQTRRKGWASFEKPLPEMISMGASYLILIDPTNKDLEIGNTYKIVTKTNKYVIFNLREKL